MEDYSERNLKIIEEAMRELDISDCEQIPNAIRMIKNISVGITIKPFQEKVLVVEVMDDFSQLELENLMREIDGLVGVFSVREAVKHDLLAEIATQTRKVAENIAFAARVPADKIYEKSKK